MFATTSVRTAYLYNISSARTFRGHSSEMLGDICAGLMPADCVDSLQLSQHEYNLYILLRRLPPVPIRLHGIYPQNYDREEFEYNTMIDYLLNENLIEIEPNEFCLSEDYDSDCLRWQKKCHEGLIRWGVGTIH
jgi:hypothetical protein